MNQFLSAPRLSRLTRLYNPCSICKVTGANLIVSVQIIGSRICRSAISYRTLNLRPLHRWDTRDTCSGVHLETWLQSKYGQSSYANNGSPRITTVLSTDNQPNRLRNDSLILRELSATFHMSPVSSRHCRLDFLIATSSPVQRKSAPKRRLL